MSEVRTANAPLREQLRPADGERPERDAARALMQQIRDNLRGAQEEIRGILTDEQEAKLRELRADRDGPGGPGGRGGPGFGRGGPGFGGPGMGGPAGMDLLRLRERLGLTDDQVARLREIREQLAEENRPLLQQLRDSGERPRGPDAQNNPIVQQIRANVEEAAAQMKAVLTAEQTAQLEELRERMRERMEERGERRGPRGGMRGSGPRGGASGR
jgi:Spy/CpxP family protein refolding chaperone